MISAIASDLDGTFLGADGQASARNVEAVLTAAERGVRTIVATGRPYRWLSVLEPILEAEPLVLASNGAVRYDLAEQRVISADLLHADDTLAVVADLREHLPYVVLGVELLEGYAVDRSYPFRDDREHLLLDVPVERALAEHSPVKLLVLARGVATDELAAQVVPVVDDRLTTTWSFVGEHGLLEVSRAGVDKGAGLATLLDELGIDPATVAAFGDMPNDLTMLGLVGHPFRMEDCHPLLVEAGYPVAGHHDESAVGERILELLGDDAPVGPEDAPLRTIPITR